MMYSHVVTKGSKYNMHARRCVYIISCAHSFFGWLYCFIKNELVVCEIRGFHEPMNISSLKENLTYSTFTFNSTPGTIEPFFQCMASFVICCVHLMWTVRFFK